MRINTESMHFTADEKLIMLINQKIEKLNQYFDKIIDANVILKLENSGQVKDKIIEVKLNVPGDVIFCKEINKTFENALDKILATLKRQLIRYKERKFGR